LKVRVKLLGSLIITISDAREKDFFRLEIDMATMYKDVPHLILQSHEMQKSLRNQTCEKFLLVLGST
jgi:hypothetical protein